MKKYDEAVCNEVVNKFDLDSEKKTVFMIGDSMRMGCCENVKKYLSDVANVFYPEENCRYTQYTYVNLVPWANALPDWNDVDVVYWNNGHWDIAHWDDDGASLNSVDIYCNMLTRIYDKLRKMFPNAKIIFSTTTPMNPANIPWINWRTTEEIKEYNNAALKTLENMDVIIYDAFDLLKDKPSEFYADFCHLTDEGFDYLGKAVADFIKKLL